MYTKTDNVNNKKSIYSFLIIAYFSVSCQESEYDQMKSYLDDISVINTHSHQDMPWKKRYNCFDAGLYLHADLISAGMPEYSEAMEKAHDAEAFWEHSEKYLRFCQTTSYYTQFVYNYQQLYGLEKSYLTKSDFLDFSEKMDANFKQYDNWLDSVCSSKHIDKMFADRLWQAYDTDFDTAHFRYVFRFDQLVLESTEVALSHKITNKQALAFIQKDELEIPNLRSYLDYIDTIIERLVQHDVVSLKMGLAYYRSLDFKIVETQEAEKVFLLDTFAEADKILLQDYVVSYIAKKAAEYQLPIQIHTGYLHGNRGYLDRGHPMKLVPLLRSNPKTKFVLFHGGFPWTGDFMVLAKCYPNVFLDIVWLPQLSRITAIRTLHEMLDCVPYNKICWGGDTGNIDDAAGSLELGREVVAKVLSDRIENGWATKEIAEDIARRIFRENAIDMFNLNLEY